MNEVKVFQHPGFGKRKRKQGTKGRVVKDEVLKAVSDITGTTLRRDLLLEYLHKIHDHFQYLHVDHMAALAHLMRLSQTEIYEVASFYAHFDIIHDDAPVTPKTTIRVCDSLTCALYGADKLLQELHDSAPSSVKIQRAPCMGRCHQAPVAEVGHKHFTHTNKEAILQAAHHKDTHPEPITQALLLDEYQKQGGYGLLQKLLKEPAHAEHILAELSASNLRGLGGAGFPAAKKMSIVRSFDGPRLMAVNGDEGEPGTIKDYHYLSQNPHQILEGMLIAAKIVEAECVYFYLRDEYPDIHALLQQEIAKIEQAGLSEHTVIELRRGAGAYICGEESSMLESIEGKRPLPRHRPPFVAEKGLFNKPTLVHNVETLYWICPIVEKGGKWFFDHGRNERHGLRSFSVSGRVKNPGVKLAPAGITIQELIDEYCDGMLDGHQFNAYLPGGASGGILPASMNNIPLDFDTLQPYGCFIGSAAIVILSDKDDIKEAALNLMRFFEDESCGQCTPCRSGTEKAVALMAQEKWDVELLQELSQVMIDASICGLGQAAPNPLLCVLKYFKDEL